MNISEKEDFLKTTIPKKLDHLKADQKPLWGKMTAQHMVEHLVSSWRIGNGKAEVECRIPDKQLGKYRDFLFSEAPFEKNITNPALPDKGLLPLRKRDLEEAKEQLLKEIDDLFQYFEENPAAEPVHPVFHKLDKKGWIQFQHKHVTHHFKQFGLI